MVKNFFRLFIFSAFLTSTPSVAQDFSEKIAKCAVVSGELDRLACFDDIAEAAGLNGPQSVAVSNSDTGKWNVSKDVNPIDDSVRVTAILYSTNTKSTWGKRVSLVARCMSNKTEVYINWNDYLGDDSNSVYADWKNLTIRIGEAKAIKQRWGISTDKEATFAPKAIQLLKSMVGNSKFLAQTTPYNESPVTAIFDTTGSKNALSPLAEACNWELPK